MKCKEEIINLLIIEVCTLSEDREEHLELGNIRKAYEASIIINYLNNLIEEVENYQNIPHIFNRT